MQQNQPCKIELKWPACCPRCGLDLRVTPVASPTTTEEPFSLATITLKETAKRLAQKIESQENPEDAEEHLDQQQKPVDDPVPVKHNVEPITFKGETKILPPATETGVPILPPLPENLKQETPPPPPPSISEPSVVTVKQESDILESQSLAASTANQAAQSISQYYGLLPTPTQLVAYTPQIQPVGQQSFNMPPPIMLSQQSQQPLWTSQQQPQPQQQVQYACYQSAIPWYRPSPPPVLVQQVPRYVQYPVPPPVNFPFPPPSLASLQQGSSFQQQQLSTNQSAMVPGNGIFTVQHHFLNAAILPQQQQQG